ncbi:MAG: protein kinase, partial [Planctomycetaceae bacterium]
LGLGDRLELLVLVCLAVQHAHQKGIIHRDLKPTNILVGCVDGRPVPKIIDFGLARAMDQSLADQTQFTQFGQIVGTIDYMSPEQASLSHFDLDTRTDVYSLGVLLYELLTGETPFCRERCRRASFDELLRMIRLEEPPRPSARLSDQASLPTIAANRRVDPRKLSGMVSGELDWIVMKALEKDCRRRYESASSLAQDVQRYLANEAVSACPPSMSYRLRKLLARHKAAFAGVVSVAAVLLLGLVGTTWQAIRATLAERDATASLARAIQAEEMRNEMLWNSLLAQAQARRWSGRQGQRFASLAALEQAATIRPSLELRNEAIACLALMDIRVQREWVGCPGGPAQVGALAFDQRLERYARSDVQGNVSIRRVDGDQELQSLPGSGLWVPHICFSPDGTYVAVVHLGNMGVDNLLHLWKLGSGGPEQVLSTSVVHSAVDFSPDGNELAVAQIDRSIRVYRVQDGHELRQLATEFPWSLKFDSQGRRLAVCDRSIERADVCDAQSGSVISRFSYPLGSRLYAIAWHPSGERLAMACGRRVALGNPNTGEIDKWLEGPVHDTIDNIAYNQSGDLLVTDSWDGRAAFWDGNNDTLLLSAMDVNQRGRGPHYQFSPDGSHLGYNLADRHVQLWEVAQPREFVPLMGDGNHSVAFHPAGRFLAILDESRLRIWDLALRQQVSAVSLAGYWSLQFHPSGEWLVAVNAAGVHRMPFALSESNEPERLVLGSPTPMWKAPYVQQAVVSPDGTKVAVSRSVGPGAILDWNQPNRPVLLDSHPNMNTIVFSADSRRVYTGTWKGRGVRIWDSATGTPQGELPEISGSAAVTCSPDGRWIATSEEAGYCLWDAHSTTRERRAEGPGTEIPGAFAFSPDRATAALAVTAGGIRLIDVSSGEQFATLASPSPRPVEGLRFSPDGTQLAVSVRGAVELWDLRAVRTQLAKIGLDWRGPASAPVPDEQQYEPIQFESPITADLAVASGVSPPLPERVSEAELVQNLGRLTKRPLAFASLRTGDLDIFLADPAAGTFVNLTQNPAADSGPAWSPDGTRIAFESTRTGNYDVFVMNADGSEPRQLTDYADEDRMPAWSPDGRFLCFRRQVREQGDNWELMVMDAEGTSVRNLSNHPASEADPAWSVVDRIAFGSNRVDQRWSVFTMQPDGSDVQHIRKFTTGWFPHPCWSPDGARLAFTAVAFQHRQISVMDADGRNERRLTNLKGLSILASWSPDGQHIAFMHRADHFPETTASLYVMRSDGTELLEVGPVEGHINGGRPGWKP